MVNYSTEFSWIKRISRDYILNSGYELKSHLCTLNRAEDHINGCTLRSRPCPNTAGKFGLGLSALPQKPHTTATTVSLFLFCAYFGAKNPWSNHNTYCRYCTYALWSCIQTYAHCNISQINFALLKTTSLICLFSSVFLMFFVREATVNILPIPCFISNLREMGG